MAKRFGKGDRIAMPSEAAATAPRRTHVRGTPSSRRRGGNALEETKVEVRPLVDLTPTGGCPASSLAARAGWQLRCLPNGHEQRRVAQPGQGSRQPPAAGAAGSEPFCTSEPRFCLRSVSELNNRPRLRSPGRWRYP
jgi:hypothetical protein